MKKKIKKIASAVLLFSVLVPFFFACKHDKGGQNNATSEKELVLDSFKIGSGIYQKEEKKISVTTHLIREKNIKDVVFKDTAGNEVKNVSWRMEPNEVRLTN